MKLLYADKLKDKKNLLAFSSGVDSTALFFVLLEQKIKFDIAIVDYGLREESELEIAYAKELAFLHKKQFFLHKSRFISRNFEHEARKERYMFFDLLCKKHGYENLILAHQLNDRLEWFLMRFCAGAGVVSLSGFSGIEKGEYYSIIRPFIETSRDEIEEYLRQNNITYFVDSTNFDESIKRNFFRHNISNKLITHARQGIVHSFRYLQQEKDFLLQDVTKLAPDFYRFTKLAKLQNIYTTDVVLKKLGLLLSFKMREEIIKNHFSNIFIKADYIFIIDSNEKFIFVLKTKNTSNPMTKNYKEVCRILHVPVKLRAHLFQVLVQGMGDEMLQKPHEVKKLSKKLAKIFG